MRFHSIPEKIAYELHDSRPLDHEFPKQGNCFTHLHCLPLSGDLDAPLVKATQKADMYVDNHSMVVLVCKACADAINAIWPADEHCTSEWILFTGPDGNVHMLPKHLARPPQFTEDCEVIETGNQQLIYTLYDDHCKQMNADFLLKRSLEELLKEADNKNSKRRLFAQTYGMGDRRLRELENKARERADREARKALVKRLLKEHRDRIQQ